MSSAVTLVTSNNSLQPAIPRCRSRVHGMEITADKCDDILDCLCTLIKVASHCPEINPPWTHRYVILAAPSDLFLACRRFSERSAEGTY